MSNSEGGGHPRQTGSRGRSIGRHLPRDLSTIRGVRRVENSDFQQLMRWKEQMSRDVEQQNWKTGQLPTPAHGMGQEADVYPIDEDVIRVHDAAQLSVEMSEPALSPIDPSKLNPGQSRAFNIVKEHLDETLSGQRPKPLRMLLHGEGGTGKSKVIQTITEYFAHRGARHLLVKSTYTGVATSLIDGKTTHSIAMITRGDERAVSAQTKAKLQHFWRDYEYLIIDEMSMIGKTFLAKLSRNIAVGKMMAGAPVSSESFGGINVIMSGDFHQFPPVTVGPSEALYIPGRPGGEPTLAQVGRAIYEEFGTVIILHQQMRVTDDAWLDFLTHLRMGRVQECHITMLRTLLLTDPAVERPEFGEGAWADAPLVTPRHGVRRQWNEVALRKHACLAGKQVFVCTAEDTVKGEPLSLEERYAFASRGVGGEKQGRRRKSDLPDTVELSLGMKVMVTQNVETDLDITNGARGTIVDVVLHADEPPLQQSDGVIHLKFLPAYILVKLTRTRTSHLPGLEPGVIPVEALTKTYSIRYTTSTGVAVSRRVRRQQYPMTCAYAFTDYRSQGQTISHIIVDIARPPTGGLNLFNLYVALSRSSGRSTIRLLRDFDEKLFLCSHSSHLLAEDDRLADLDRQTAACTLHGGALSTGAC